MMTSIAALAVTPAEVADMPLEDWGPIASSIGETVRNRGRIMWSGDGIEIGVWECDAGRFRAAFTGRGEFMQIVAGRMVCHGEDGSVVEAAAGTACTFPPEWTGEWQIEEPVRKLYCEFKSSERTGDQL